MVATFHRRCNDSSASSERCGVCWPARSAQATVSVFVVAAESRRLARRASSRQASVRARRGRSERWAEGNTHVSVRLIPPWDDRSRLETTWKRQSATTSSHEHRNPRQNGFKTGIGDPWRTFPLSLRDRRGRGCYECHLARTETPRAWCCHISRGSNDRGSGSQQTP
jgi:hypothetical protein